MDEEKIQKEVREIAGYALSYADSRFAEGEAKGKVEDQIEGEIIGAVRTFLRQIKGGRNDVSSAAQDMNLTIEEFRQLVHDLYPDEVLPE